VVSHLGFASRSERDEMWRRRRERSTKTLADACDCEEDIIAAELAHRARNNPRANIRSLSRLWFAASGFARHP
jgi:hypothetical protein